MENKWIINKDEYDEYVKKTKKKITKNIRITKTKKEFQFILTDNSVQLQIREEPLFYWLIIFDKNTIKFYEKMFIKLWEESKQPI